MTLQTWLIILEIIQLVRKMLKKCSNTLNIIKNSEIKHGRIISGQKELLNLFDDVIYNKTLKPESQEDKNKEKK